MQDQITLDVSMIIDKETLHEYISKILNFPGYYGQNWDAFDECIRDVELPKELLITHFEELNKQLPREANLMKECLLELEKDKPIKIKFC
jgi:RNAse (barnase) inhibitor barstar